MQDIDQTDIDRARRRVKEEYREDTGHELPDHVLDNLEYLGTAGLRDRAEIEAMIEEARETGKSDPEDWLALAAWLGLTILTAVYLTRYLSGVGAQAVGGVAIWLALFGGSGLAIDAITDRFQQEGVEGNE